MKVAVILDDDGHFRVAPLSDREKVMEILELSDDGGDRIESEADGLENYDRELWDNYKIISNTAWERVLGHFEQRGDFEIIEI